MPIGDGTTDYETGDLVLGLGDQQRRELSQAAWVATDEDPALAAKEQAVADQLGVDRDLVRDNVRDMEAQTKYSELRSDLHEISRRDPETASYLANPDVLAVAKDDVKTFNKMLDERSTSEYVSTHWENSWGNEEIAYPSYSDVLANLPGSSMAGMTQDDRDRVEYYKRKQRERGEPELPGGVMMPVAYTAGAVADLFPYIYGSMKAKLAGYATAGGAVGAVAGAATMIRTRDPKAAAKVATKVGKAVGGPVGTTAAAIHMNIIEGGLMWDQLQDVKYDGEKLDPQVAAVTSAMVGLINGGIEFFQLRMVTGPWQDLVTRRAFRKQIGDALKDRTIRKALFDFAKAQAKLGAFEGGTESLQEFVNVAAEIFARKIDFNQYVYGDGGSWDEIRKAHPDWEEGDDSLLTHPSVQQILAAGMSAAVGSMAIGAPAQSLNVSRQVARANKVGQDQARLERSERIIQESELNGREGGKRILGQSPVVQSAGDVFIDAASVLNLVQGNPKIIEDIFDSVPGMDVDTLANHAATGQKVRMPYSDFVEHVHGSEYFSLIKPTVTLKETDPTEAEIKEGKEDKPEVTAEDIQAQQEDIVRRKEARQELETKVFEQLDLDPRATEGQARAEARIFASSAAAFAGIWSAVSGETITAMDVYNRKVESIRVEGEDQVDLAQPEAEDLGPTTSEPFQDWFQESKVVDAEGKPAVVYHTTTKDFESFVPGGLDPELSGEAIWFSPNPGRVGEEGTKYDIPPAAHNVRSAETEGARIIDAYVSLQNPQVIQFNEESNQWEDQEGNVAGDAYYLGNGAVDRIKEQGYDGLILLDKDTGQTEEIVAFEPEQVKSTRAKKFDPNDPRILHSPSAFHGGTPGINKFDMSFVRTGEGHGLRGSGHYLADMRAVADHYRHMIPVWKRKKHRRDSRRGATYEGEAITTGIEEHLDYEKALIHSVVSRMVRIRESIEPNTTRPYDDVYTEFARIEIQDAIEKKTRAFEVLMKQHAEVPTDPNAKDLADRNAAEIKELEDELAAVSKVDPTKIVTPPALPFGMKVSEFDAIESVHERLREALDVLEESGLDERDPDVAFLRDAVYELDQRINRLLFLTPQGVVDTVKLAFLGDRDSIYDWVKNVGERYSLRVSDLIDRTATDPGQLYEVDVPHKEDLMFWDGTLDLHSAHVLDALRRIFDIRQNEDGQYEVAALIVPGVGRKRLNGMLGNLGYYEVVLNEEMDEILINPTAGDLYKVVTNYFGGWNPPSNDKASKFFHDYTGLPGLHFLDQGSRPRFGENLLAADSDTVIVVGGKAITVGSPVLERLRDKLLASRDVDAVRKQIEGSAAMQRLLDIWVEEGISYRDLRDAPIDPLEGTTSNYVIWDDDMVNIQRTFYQDAAAPVPRLDIDAEPTGKVTWSSLSGNAQALAVSRMLDGTDAMDEIEGTGKEVRGKRSVKVGDIALHYAHRIHDNFFGPMPMNNETSRLLAEVLAHETAAALKRTGAAKDWYDRTMREAIEFAGLVHPAILDNNDHRFMYTMILAITSNGAKVNKNASMALEMYAEWAKTGRIPIRGIGAQKNTIEETLRDVQTLVDDKGIEWLEGFMKTEFTVGELGTYGFKTNGELAEEGIYGSVSLLGPKIGAFFQNLSGEFGPITMDRWFMRTIGRMRGDIISLDRQKIDKKIASFRVEVKKNRDYVERYTDLDIDEILSDDLTAEEAAHEIYNHWGKRARFKDGMPIEQAARGVSVASDPKIAPATGSERHWLRQTMNLAQRHLKANGIEIDNASMQAVLWVMEKDLYRSLGARVDKETDYATENRRMAEEAGIDAERITEAADRAGRGETPAGRAGAVGKSRKRLTRYLAVHRTRHDLQESSRGADSTTEAGPFRRGAGGAFAGKRSLNKGVQASKLSLAQKFRNRFSAANIDTTEIWELKDKDHEGSGAGPKAANEFFTAITAAKGNNKFGASVYVYPEEEYAEMRLLLSPDKKSGVALNGDDIVSAFSWESDSDGKPSIAPALVHAAIQLGGRRLDGFDTVLGDIYGTMGFRVVARDSWNEGFKPTDWNKKTFRKFKKGEPDILYMVYDPDYYDEYRSDDGERVSGYDEAVALQAQEVTRLWGKPRILYSPPAPATGVGNGSTYDKVAEAEARADAKARSWTNDPRFLAWAEGAEVVLDTRGHDFDGTPVIVLNHHGTTHNIEEVIIDNGNPENFVGLGFYGSTSFHDAVNHYAGIGPDLRMRIEELNDQLTDTSADELWETFEGEIRSLPGDLDKLDVDEIADGNDVAGMDYDDLLNAIAHSVLVGDQPEGQVRTVFTKMRQPFVIVESGSKAHREISENWLDFGITLDEETGEESFSETTQAVLDTLDELAETHDFDAGEAKGSFVGRAIDGMTTGDFIEWVSKEELGEARNYETGKLDAGDMFRVLVESMGYDGVIHQGVEHRFRGMSLHDATDHVVAYDSSNVKDVANTGDFELGTSQLLRQPEEGEPPSDPNRGEVKRKPRGGIEFLPDGRARIHLLEARDPTTFMHESSHLFLSLYEDLVKTYGEDALPAGFAEDWQTIRDWQAVNAQNILGWIIREDQRPRLEETYGADVVQRALDRGVRGVEDQAQRGDFSSSFGHDGVIAEAMHENWAAAFETYLQTGGAPTAELRSAFQKFRAWITTVYNGIRGEVSPEIRDVFDRMVAAEQEIDRVDRAFQYGSIDELRMRTEDRERYKREIELARVKALENADQAIVNDKLKERQTQYKERKEAIAQEVRGEYESRPIYRANEFLRKGKLFSDEESLPLEPGKLNSEILRAQYPGEQLKGLGSGERGVRAEDGTLAPEQVAEAFAIPEDELIPGLIGLTPMNEAVRNETKRRLDEEFKASEKEFLAEVEEATHSNEHRELALVLEHKAIREAMKDEVAAAARRQVASEGPGTAQERGASVEAAEQALREAQATDDDEAATNAMIDLTRARAAQKEATRVRGAVAGEVGRQRREGAEERREQQGRLDAEERAEVAGGVDTEREARAARREAREAGLDKEESLRLEREVRRNHDSLRAVARRDVAAIKVGELQPSKYRAAEQRAARTERRAIAKDDWIAAEEAMYQRIYNYYAYAAALDQERRNNANVRAVKQKAKTVPRRKRKPGTSTLHLEEMIKLINRFDLSGISISQAKKRERVVASRTSLIDYMRKLAETAQYIQLPDDMFIRFEERSNYKLMTSDELEDLRNAVDSMAHQDMEEIKSKQIEAEQDMQEARDDLARGSQRTRFAGKFREKKGGGVAAFHAMHTKMEYVFRWLDGEHLGKIWRRWYMPFEQAANEEGQLVGDYASRLHDLYNETWSKAERAAWAMPFVGKRYYESVGKKYSKAEILSIALNWGNDQNRAAIMTSFGWSFEQVNELLDEAMEARDWVFVQSVWNMIDELWPRARNLHKEMTGITSSKVERSSVVTQHGTFEGGYYPLRYDPDSSLFIMQQTEAESAKGLMGGMWASKMTRHGHLNARKTNGAAGKEVLLDLGVIENHLTQVIHDVTHRKAVVNAAAMLNDSQIQGIMKDAIGTQMVKRMNSWVQAIATGDQHPALEGATMFRRLQSGATIMAMGWNLGTALMQPAGMTKSVKHLGEKYALKGMYAYMGEDWMNGTSKVESFLPIRQNMLRMQEFIFERSKMMPDRSHNMDRDMRQAHRQAGPTAILPAAEMALWMIGYTQSFVDQATWLGAYMKVMDGEVSEIEMGNEKDAILYADQTVRLSQSHGDIKDLAAIQRGSPFQRIFTMFYSFFSSQYNDLADELKMTDQGRRIMLPRTLANFFWIALLPPVYEEMVRSVSGDDDFGPDDDDKRGDAAYWFVKVAAYNAGSAVFVRNVVQGWESGYGFSLSPIDRSGESVVNMLRKLEEGDLDSGFWKDTGYTFGTAAALAGYPIPSAKAMQHTHTLVRWLSGDFHPGDALRPRRNR